MDFTEIGAFDLLHRHLAWPWVAIDAGRTRVAFFSAEGTVATRTLFEGRLIEGPTFRLPEDLGLPTERAPAVGHRGAKGIHGLSIDSLGTRIALTGTVDEKSIVVTIDADGDQKRSAIDSLTGADFTAHAIAFDRRGERLWISVESAEETGLVLIDTASHALLGFVRSAPFPPPSSHELHVHPVDDAVLLLAACGQDGTFARIAGWSDGPPSLVPTALDGGGEPAGFVGFSIDGARVHMVESEKLRTHAWPGLEELSSVDLASDFVSSYAGVVLGHTLWIDGQDAETEEDDAVMIFDRAGIRGSVARPPVPTGMWVGRLGPDAIVTVASKGDPVRGRVIRIPVPAN